MSIVTPSKLLALSPEDFEKVVTRALPYRANPGVWDALTHLSVISRTRTCLGSLSTSVQAQLSEKNAELEQVRAEGQASGPEGKKAYFAAVNAQAEWRRRTLVFQRSVHNRLALVKSRTPKGPTQPQSPDSGAGKRARAHNRNALAGLARAIAGHRREVRAGDRDVADKVLWRHLAAVTVIDQAGDEVSVADWLEDLAGQE